MSDEMLTGANSALTDRSVANRLLRDPLGLRINHERSST
jgi:hypothetical protein